MAAIAECQLYLNSHRHVDSKEPYRALPDTEAAKLVSEVRIKLKQFNGCMSRLSDTASSLSQRNSKHLFTLPFDCMVAAKPIENNARLVTRVFIDHMQNEIEALTERVSSCLPEGDWEARREALLSPHNKTF